MKFIIDYNDNMEQRDLIYRADEFSFDMEPQVHEIDFELAINTLTLTVVDDKIVQVWGFCGLNRKMKANYTVPQYKGGALKVIDDLEPGFAYSIYKEEQPIYINIQTGWICIGNPEKKGNAVEFIRNCVAVIGDGKDFISLWLKPEKLPKI
jgi:hypothetical protein